MNKYTKLIRWFLLLITFVIPVAALAQTSTEGQPDVAPQQINSWRGQDSNLNNKISNLDDTIVEDLPLPILFGLTPANLTRNFGDPRSDGRTHEGLDIMAPKRALVVSPTDSVVIRTGVGASAGNYVYTANPGGETFAYMHLDEIADIHEGDELAKGDLIGYVGNTGNAAGGATHLHFEIRHDNGATDPFPRLTRIFPLADKISYLNKILENSKDQSTLVAYVESMYSKDLNLAKSLNIVLPKIIESTFNTTAIPASTSSATVNSGSSNNPSLNLSLGSKGIAVVALQKFLISKNVGSAKRIVADGSFGPITKQALAEYQASVGISPASGYFGPITRAYISIHP